jgi:rRNA maturation RNase YbeY
MAITFTFQITKFSIPQKKKLHDWILLVSYLEQAIVVDIDYIFCDDEYLLKLNQHFLGHKTYTDILTFDFSVNKEIHAEIYISIDRIKENASQFQVSIEEELRRVMIHGVLHCLGYSDKTEKSKTVMRKKENKYLKIFSEMK